MRQATDNPGQLKTCRVDDPALRNKSDSAVHAGVLGYLEERLAGRSRRPGRTRADRLARRIRLQGCDGLFPGSALQRFRARMPVSADKQGCPFKLFQVVRFDDVNHVEPA